MKLFALFLVACGGGGGGGTPDAAVVADTHHVGTGKMTLHAVEAPGSLNTTAERPGIAGAVISVVLPGGEHREVTTGADGTVVVDGIDWSAGTASAIAWAPGHSLYGVNGVSPDTFAMVPHVDSGDVVFSLIPDATSVTLAVTIDNTIGAIVSGDHAVTSLIGSGVFSLAIAPNTPQKLLLAALPSTVEGPVTRWATFDVPAQAAAGTLEIDAVAGGTTVTPTHITHHVTLPVGYESSQVQTTVWTLESLGLAGESSEDAGGDGSSPRDVTIEYVSITPEPLLITFIKMASGKAARHLIAGTIPDGASYALLAPLDAATVSGTTVTMPVTPAGTYVSIVGSEANGHRLRVEAPPGTTAITVPPLPTGAPHFSYSTQAVASQGYDPHARIYADQAFSDAIAVKL